LIGTDEADAAIGSLWALVLAGVISVMLFIRTALEDRVLKEELAGYAAYAYDTHFKLLPGIWKPCFETPMEGLSGGFWCLNRRTEARKTLNCMG
jgi:hypothetical protein